MTLIDSHAHITSPQFALDERKTVLERAFASGVSKILNISTKRNELEEAYLLGQEKLSCAFLHAASTTPHEASLDDPFFLFVEEQALSKKLAAVGETGLDYFYEHAPRDVQKICLQKYLDLSLRAKLPVVIHCRDAFPDFISILDDYNGRIKGVLHCFTGTLDDARMLLDRGFFISFSGIVTYPKSGELQEVLRFIPKSHLLLETDAPYLAPQGFRGKRCEPAMINKTYALVAEMVSVSLDSLQKSVFEAFHNFLAH